MRLQVILNRKILQLPLGLAWPAALFDSSSNRCLMKLPAAKRPANYDELLEQLQSVVGSDLAGVAEHNTMVIGKALGDANAIWRRYHLTDRHLTLDEFQREYNSAASRQDFLEYMEARILERHRRGQISDGTKKKQLSTHNKLREFAAYTRDPRRHRPWGKGRGAGPLPHEPHVPLPFNALTHKFSGDFDAWLKKAHGSCLNTRSGRHRNVKAYLELARRDKITFEDPYQYFVNARVDGQWKALSEEELQALEQYYTRLEPGSTHRRVLQKFLFSCHCGLRLGDLKAIDQMQIEGQKMRLKPHKTYRYDEKDLTLPITRVALSYLQDSRTENGREGFFLYSDQYTNRQLRRIADLVGIKTHLHHHIGRETFATNFIRQGGKVEVLQKLLGHKKLSMTMKYVHVDEAMKDAEIARLDELHSKTKKPR